MNDIIRATKEKVCNLPGDLKNVDGVSIKQILTNDFANPNAMRALECIIFLILHTSKEGGVISEKVNNYLTNTTKTSASGAYGMILFSHMIKDAEVVIKTLKTPDADHKKDMKEEYLKALIINEMRYHVPTFNYTLGFFECNTFSTKTNKLCPASGGQNTFMVVEKVAGKTLSELLEDSKLTFSQFLQLYVQILISLEMGQRMIQFCHWDLHPGNIMVSQRPIRYRVLLEDLAYDFDAGMSPVIIDFGMTSVTDSTRTYGTNDYSGVGRFDYSVPAHDMYWLLMGCFARMFGNFDISKQTERLFEFFGPDAPYKAEKIINDYGNDIYSSKIASKTPLEFLKWIQSKYDLPFMKVTPRDMMYNIYYIPSNTIYHQLLRAPFAPENITKCLKDMHGLIICAYFARVLSRMRNELEFRKLDSFIKGNNGALVKYDEGMLSQYKNCPEVSTEFKADANRILGYTLRADKAAKKDAIAFSQKYDPIFASITSYYYIMILIKDVKLEDHGIYKAYIQDYLASRAHRDFAENYSLFIKARRWCNSIISS